MKLTFKNKREFAEAILKYGKLYWGNVMVYFDENKINPFRIHNLIIEEEETITHSWANFNQEWSTTPPLKDKDLVWCWDNDDTHGKHVKFFDCKNNTAFTYNGNRCGASYQNYEKYQGEWPQWAKEAVKTLED